MNKINLLLKLMLLLLILPYRISTGSKKGTWFKIKRIIIKMNLH